MHWIYVGFMIAIGIAAAYALFFAAMMVFGALYEAWERINQ